MVTLFLHERLRTVNHLLEEDTVYNIMLFDRQGYSLLLLSSAAFADLDWRTIPCQVSKGITYYGKVQMGPHRGLLRMTQMELFTELSPMFMHAAYIVCIANGE